MTVNDSKIIAVSIERALLDIDLTAISAVERLLKEKYNAKFANCYENPHYLKEILEKHYPEKHAHIIELIRKYVLEFDLEFNLEDFLDKIKPC